MKTKTTVINYTKNNVHYVHVAQGHLTRSQIEQLMIMQLHVNRSEIGHVSFN